MAHDMRFTFGNIQADTNGHHWLLNGCEREAEDDALNLMESDLQELTATNLRRIYRRLYEHLGWHYCDAVIHEGSLPTEFDVRDIWMIPRTEVTFKFEQGELFLLVECFLEINKNGRHYYKFDIETLITPLLTRKRLWFVDVDAENYSDDNWRFEVKLGFNPRSRLLADLHTDGEQIKALVEASSGGVTRETVAELVRGGHVESLLGQPEGDWLEAKRQHADLESETGKIRLAQWVSQFANTPDGGVVVLGLATSNRGTGDVITKVTPLPRSRGSRRKYVQVLDNKVIPPIEDLRVETIPFEEGDLILIEVPPQSEESKPFLVHGAVLEGNAKGNFFSIVRRRNDEMASTHPANVHANLTVGRAFLRRGDFPDI